MKFTIHGEQVRLHHLNVRTETHGDEERTAVDLKLYYETGNEALLQFHPRLRALLYENPPANQPTVEGVEPAPVVRVFPDLHPLHWSADFACSLAILHGLGDGRDIVLADCTADGFVIEPLEGGTVKLAFRIRSICMDEQILGRLPLLLHRDLPITLLPIGRRAAKSTRSAKSANDEQSSLLP